MNSPNFIRLLVFGAFVLLTSGKLAAQDKLVNILDEEIQREMEYLKKQEIPAYYISYRVDEIFSSYLNTSFGAISGSNESKVSYLTVTVRVGSPELDNFHPLRGDNLGYAMPVQIDLPGPDKPLAIKQVVWGATTTAYQTAVANYAKVKANIATKVEEEDKSPDFVLGQPNVAIDAPFRPEDLKFNKAEWETRLKKYSAVFLKDKSIFGGSAYISYRAERKYFVSSNGDKVVQNGTSTHAGFSGTIKADDGMELPLNESYFAFKPEGLPSDKEMTIDVNQVVNNLIALKNAPIAEPFSGPALLSGKASGVFFHEIFGHRVEGSRMKNESDAQTFKKKVDEPVLPANFSVYFDPQMKEFGGLNLNGYYRFDDEGQKGQHVNIVDKGVLKNFLMSSTPIKGFSVSNGHGRAQASYQPVSRQSNLVIETSQLKKEEELRAELIRIAKEQNKPYGYLFQQVVGGFTNTGRFVPNSFNVTPTLVYRVYTDGRPDEIVRGVDLIGTPLSMFSQIDQAGGKIEIFNGTCGAESGGVPVSAVSPMILVKIIETQKKSKSQERNFILPRPDNK